MLTFRGYIYKVSLFKPTPTNQRASCLPYTWVSRCAIRYRVPPPPRVPQVKARPVHTPFTPRGYYGGCFPTGKSKCPHTPIQAFMWTIQAQFLNYIIWYAIVFRAVPSQLDYAIHCCSQFQKSKMKRSKPWMGMILLSCIVQVLFTAASILITWIFPSTCKVAYTAK